MIRRKENVEEQDGKYLINATNLNLAIADANAKGMSLNAFKTQLYAKIDSYITDLLKEEKK